MMDIGEGAAVGIGATLIGWMGSVFFHGRKVGSVEQQFKTLIQESEEQKKAIAVNKVESAEHLQKVKVELGQEIARLKLHHDQDMQRLQEHKFITAPEHEGMCDRNNRLVVEAVKSLTAAMEKNTEVVAKMGDKIHILDKDVAVLKERRDGAGLRQDRSVE